MSTRHPEFRRDHLESLLIAHARIDAAYVDVCAPERLSAACNTILDHVARYPAACREDLLIVVPLWPGDEDVLELSERVDRLTVAELLFFSRETVAALCDRLPVVLHKPAGDTAVAA